MDVGVKVLAVGTNNQHTVDGEKVDDPVHVERPIVGVADASKPSYARKVVVGQQPHAKANPSYFGEDVIVCPEDVIYSYGKENFRSTKANVVPNDSNGTNILPTDKGKSSVDAAEGLFGPWMLVENKRQRMASGSNTVNQKDQLGSAVSGSRFQVLEGVDDVDEGAKVKGNNGVQSKSVDVNAPATTSVHRELALRPIVSLNATYLASNPSKKTLKSSSSIKGLVAVESMTRKSVLIEDHDPKIAKERHKAVKVVEDRSRLLLSSSSRMRGILGGVGQVRKDTASRGLRIRSPGVSKLHDQVELADWVNDFVDNLASIPGADLVALVEPRVSGLRANRVVTSLGYLNSLRVETHGFSGGIWLLLNDVVSVEASHIANQFVHGVVRFKDDVVFYCFTIVYVSPQIGLRKHVWKLLEDLDLGDAIPWVLGGDFNSIFDKSERSGGSLLRDGMSKSFRDFICDNRLMDLGFKGSLFTWKRGSVQARLDRCLVNIKWLQSFPNGFVQHLDMIGSDHRPLLLRLEGSCVNSTLRPFLFIGARQDHPQFTSFLESVWTGEATCRHVFHPVFFFFK
ncbi:hypothetical protein V6N13_108669 [Hibiscus sabdariffa]